MALETDHRSGRDGGSMKTAAAKGACGARPAEGEDRKGVVKRRSGNVRRMAPADERVAAGMCRRGKEPQERRSGKPVVRDNRTASSSPGPAPRQRALQRTPQTRNAAKGKHKTFPTANCPECPTQSGRGQANRPQARQLLIRSRAAKRRSAGRQSAKANTAGRERREPLERNRLI